MNIEVKLGKNEQTKITKVLKNVGDTVKLNDAIFEIEAGKGTSTINSKAQGTIESINVTAGDSVNGDKVLAQINGELAAKADNTATKAENIDVKSGKKEEIKITKVLKNVGDTVKLNDAIFEIEAGKGTSTINSKVQGTIESINVTVGDSVNGDKVLAQINGVLASKAENTAAKTGSTATDSFDYFKNIKPAKIEMESDVTIIGGGPGGYVAAIQAAKLGAKVILIEKEKLGGTCLNWGCIPTKTLVRSAQVLETLKKADEFGCYAENVGVNMEKVIARKDKVVTQLVTGVEYLMKANKIKVIYGVAEIVNKESVLVKSKTQEVTIKAKNIVIATGSKSAIIPIKGIDNKHVIDSSDALCLKEIPKKLVVVGGGVIGMEFAYIYASFGTEVSVVEFFDKCLINCDEDICEVNKKSAEQRGIKLYNSAKVAEICDTESDECMVRFVQDGKDKFIIADKVLLAVGRTPYFEGLGLENVGVELNDRGRGVKVNSKMQTNIPNIYAIGDVNNALLLAHVASHQGVVAAKNIMGKPCDMDYSAVPAAIFTEPEIAMVGLGEKAAKQQGIEVEVGKFAFAGNGKALSYGESDGFIKIIRDKNTNRLIGAGIVGLHATDLIAVLTLAIKNNLTAEAIAETIHAHPTTAEVIHEAALSLDGGAIHSA
ncbi:dihydrolipoyl dehydrogenase [Clostridium sp.]|uniref:dihydrolipoyl dehydrogenase n=1 Tax=Clostridium sp. TaxID=1506 RepID=UPI001A51AD5E|nr:dihydrolipoyl dehydrogenase [Clostridium sp.]MBK5241957.1 dihydrolipoyl dehydrogenase [Clostridium sp.]